MNTDPFLNLNEDSFYSLITAGELPMLVVFGEMYSNRRPKVFKNAILFFQRKYHLPSLSAQQMIDITSAKTDDEKALLSFDYGDFPEFVASLQLYQANEVLESALLNKREKSAVAILQSEELDPEAALVDIMDQRCLPCLLNLLQIIDFERNYLHWVSESWHYDAADVKWVLENSSVVPGYHLLDTYLELLQENADLSLVKLFLERMTYEEATTSYLHHRDGLRTGIAASGGDYPTNDGYTNFDDVTQLFRERLKL